MKLIDISWPISEATTEYKNKDTILFETIKSFENDNGRETRISLSTHVGTHVDAPSHFIEDGKTVEKINLSRIIGRAQVLNFMTVLDSISAEDLQRYPIAEGDIILLRTANSACGYYDPFESNFIFLNESGAQYLVEKKVKAVGIDYLGIERGNSAHPTHQTLMRNDIVIIEGLRLGHVQTGTYFLICLPLALIGVEAAPARAVLLQEE